MCLSDQLTTGSNQLTMAKGKNDMATFRKDKLRHEKSDERGAFAVSLNVVLNRAARANNVGKFLVAIKISQGTDKRYFVNVDDLRISEADFDAMCREYSLWKGRQGRYADVCAQINTTYDKILSLVVPRVDEGSFDFEDFKNTWQGLKDFVAVELTPYDLWQKVASEKSAGTEESYLNALNRFKADMGMKVGFSDFSKALVEKWKNRMIASGLSKTTANIYLRALRVMLNEAVQLRLVTIEPKVLFSKLAIGGKNSYDDRKEHYLSVEQWRKLWHFYETEGEGNEFYQSWRSDYQRDRMEALGMMLFMYLADGMNLRDVLNLRFDDYYYQHDKKQLRVQRQKVKDRSGAKVIFPVLEQLRLILDRQGESEKRGGLVFGYLREFLEKGSRYMDDKEKDREERRLTALYNSTIGDRMKQIAKAVGLNVEPTPTWCRHSFASNLIQAGVPKEYISASMAHSEGSTTDNYVDRYSYEQMVDYNSRLLADPAEKDRERLKAMLAGMSKEEILKLIGGK